MTLRYVNSWKYFNAETGKEIPEEEIDSYEGACDVEADDYTQKTYTVVAEILVFVDAMDKIKAKMDAHKK